MALTSDKAWTWEPPKVNLEDRVAILEQRLAAAEAMVEKLKKDLLNTKCDLALAQEMERRESK